MSFLNEQGNISRAKKEKKRNTNLACFGLRAVLNKTAKGVFKLFLNKAV